MTRHPCPPASTRTCAAPSPHVRLRSATARRTRSALDSMACNFPQARSPPQRQHQMANEAALCLPFAGAERMRRVIWRRVFDDNALEFFTVQRAGEVEVLNGQIVTLHDGSPVLVEYEIACTPGLQRVRHARITRSWRADSSTLVLQSDGEGAWRVNGERAAQLDGCTDIGIEWTPSTNTLPANRLSRSVGARLDIEAAWVRLPALSVERSPPSYSRLEDGSARYENLAGGFHADVTSDDLGLPISYGQMWTRVAQWSSD